MLILLPITFIFTGKLEEAAAVTFTFHIVRMVLYYFHERAWERISWGRGDNNNKLWFYVSLALLVLSFILIIIMI